MSNLYQMVLTALFEGCHSVLEIRYRTMFQWSSAAITGALRHLESLGFIYAKVSYRYRGVRKTCEWFIKDSAKVINLGSVM